MLYELKKLIVRKQTLVLMLIAAVAFIVLHFISEEQPPLNAFIRDRIAEHSGIGYSDARKALQKELDNLGEKPEDYESEEYYRYAAVTILLSSADDYDKYNENTIAMLRSYEKKIAGASTEYIKNDYQYAYDCYNHAYDFIVCDTAELQYAFWNLEDNSYIFLYILFVCAFFCNIFTVENESGMHRILYSSKLGKSGLFKRKIAAGLICSLGIAFIFTAVPFFSVWTRRVLSFKLLNQPLQSVDYFELCPFSLTVGEYLLLSFAMHFLVAVLILSLIAVCSAFLKNGVVVLAISAILSIGMTAVTLPDESEIALAARRLGGCGLLSLQKYLVQYDTVNVFGIPIMSFYITVTFTVLLSVVLLLIAYMLCSGILKTGGKK